MEKKTEYIRFFESSYLEDNFGFIKEDFKNLTDSEFKKLDSLIQKQDKLLDYFMEKEDAEWVGEWEDQGGDFDTVPEFQDSELVLQKLIKKQKSEGKITQLQIIVKDILTLLKKASLKESTMFSVVSKETYGGLSNDLKEKIYAAIERKGYVNGPGYVGAEFGRLVFDILTQLRMQDSNFNMNAFLHGLKNEI